MGSHHEVTSVSVSMLVILYAAWHVAANLAPSLGVSQWYLILPSCLLILMGYGVFAYLTLALLRFVAAKIEPQERENADESDEDSRTRFRIRFPYFFATYWIAGSLLLGIFFIYNYLYADTKMIGYQQLRTVSQNLRTVNANQISDTVIVVVAKGVIILGALLGAGIVILGWLESQFKPEKGTVISIGLALTLGSTFFAAFLLAFVSSPPLPAVDVSVDANGSQGVEGTLLTHVDGYWYVFNPKGNLVSVPDDHVTNVNICTSTTGIGKACDA